MSRHRVSGDVFGVFYPSSDVSAARHRYIVHTYCQNKVVNFYLAKALKLPCEPFQHRGHPDKNCPIPKAARPDESISWTRTMVGSIYRQASIPPLQLVST